MPRPQVPEERILKAAAELFEERGYVGTTTVAIAERAGINEITLFRRFGSKHGILAALATHWAQDMAGFAVDRLAAEGRDVRSVLEELAKMEIESASLNGVAAMRLVMDSSTVPEIADVMAGNPQDNHRRLSDYMARQQRLGELREDLDAPLMAEMFFAMTSTQVIARKLLGFGDSAGLSSDEVVRQIVELFCNGILKDGGRT